MALTRGLAGCSPPQWQRDALAAGFQLEAITLVAEFVAVGVVSVDGPPIEVLPGYWVIPGFLPYDGRVILAALDRRHVVVEQRGFHLALARYATPCLGAHGGALFGS